MTRNLTKSRSKLCQSFFSGKCVKLKSIYFVSPSSIVNPLFLNQLAADVKVFYLIACIKKGFIINIKKCGDWDEFRRRLVHIKKRR